MPLIRYIDRTFSASSKVLIVRANQIIAEYLAKGYRLTLRQLYYQFVSRGWIANKQKEYKRLGSVVNDARLAGLIDWDAIEDRGRNLAKLNCWDDPRDIINACASQYRIDLWAHQPRRPEVWIEKEALAGVVAVPCQKLRVAYFPCKGYVSQSEMWDAGANRLRGYLDAGQKPLILHFGDHDPSGIDMTRDIRERLELFLGEPIDLKRIALNFDQIEEYDPPPNPAKTTDARFASYQSQYGEESWELDALNPEVLGNLIETEVLAVRDDDQWDKDVEVEAEQRGVLGRIAEKYENVRKFVNGGKS